MGLPINPVVSGLLKGYALAQQLRDSAMQQEQFQRQKLMQDRQMQVQDIQTQEMLNSAGRPIEGGTVADSMIGPDVGGVKAEYDYRRKPDAARAVKYKTRDGQLIERELYTPEEQAKRSLDSTIAKARAMNDLSIDKAAALRKLDVVDLPGVGSVPTKAVPFMTAQERAKADTARAAAANTSRETTAAANRTSQENIAKTRAAATTGAAQIRSNAKGTGDGKLTPSQANVQARADERELGEFQKQEADLHVTRRRLWGAIKGGTVFISKTGEVKAMSGFTDEEKSDLITDMKERFKSSTEQVKDAITKKNKVIERMGGKPLVSTDSAIRKIDEAVPPWEDAEPKSTSTKNPYR